MRCLLDSIGHGWLHWVEHALLPHAPCRTLGDARIHNPEFIFKVALEWGIWVHGTYQLNFTQIYCLPVIFKVIYLISSNLSVIESIWCIFKVLHWRYCLISVCIKGPTIESIVVPLFHLKASQNAVKLYNQDGSYNTMYCWICSILEFIHSMWNVLQFKELYDIATLSCTNCLNWLKYLKNTSDTGSHDNLHCWLKNIP